MKFVQTLVATVLTITFASSACALVSPEEAVQLGTALTGVGAEKAGNADGSIPEYSGGLTTAPAGFNSGDSVRPNPYASEKPILVINGENIANYKDQVTATVAELAHRYPSFHMEVYPSHRTVVLPDEIIANSRENALAAKSLDEGQAIENVLPGVPFPIPKSGAEVMWNHLLAYQGVTRTSKYDNWNVDSSGSATLATTGLGVVNYPVYEDLSKTFGGKDVCYRIKLNYVAPARRAGEATLVYDHANPLVQPRRAWQYLPGQRRVKLAPDLAYDTPNPGSSGASTFDDGFVFSGALDRFDWKLLGKKEMYVPYNAYELNLVKDLSTLTTKDHLAPALVRWEKHRVWVVEATLKPGKRHIYHKRTFYIDEDSWRALASDEYDANNQLYRGSLAFLSQNYDVKVPDTTPHMIYDLIAGNYSIVGLIGPYGGIKYIPNLSNAKWSPESLAGAGIR